MEHVHVVDDVAADVTNELNVVLIVQIIRCSCIMCVRSESTTSPLHCFQIQIKDFRFSYKFKTACKEDVLKLCPNIKKK